MSVEALVGHWRNTELRCEGVAQARVSADGDRLRIGLRVCTAEGELEWPEARCEVYECMEEDGLPGAAALGRIAVGPLDVELQLRVNKGILCLMTWTRFVDGSRHDYVTRELFARVPAHEHPFVGTWRNTDEASKGVIGLAFADDGGPNVRAWAAAGRADLPPVDLGRAPVELFGGRHDPRPLAFCARLGEVILQGNINRGLMIVAAYRVDAATATLAGQFSREFFARHHADPRPPMHMEGRGPLFRGITTPTTDVGEFVGVWETADPRNAELASLDIRPLGEELVVSVVGSGRMTGAWPAGAARVFAYCDESGRNTVLLLASFAAAWGRSELQIKVTSGTAVVAGFHTRGDGAWFAREFLHRRLDAAHGAAYEDR